MDEKQAIAEPLDPHSSERGRAIGQRPSMRLLLPLVIAAVVVLFVVVGSITGYVEKWLWMRQLGYAGIFWTLLSVQWTMLLSVFVFAFLFLWINLRQVAKNITPLRGYVSEKYTEADDASKAGTGAGIGGLAGGGGLLAGLGMLTIPGLGLVVAVGWLASLAVGAAAGAAAGGLVGALVV